jgi:hypothetical protein
MLSAAYCLLADLSSTALIAPAIRLVHLRTSEVIFGQASESVEQAESKNTEVYYERSARGKSASLLSLALELPLLLSGHSGLMSTAHEAASHFATAYQVADDLEDFDQDAREGSPNLLLLLMPRQGFTFEQACSRADELSSAQLTSAETYAGRLPHHCAAALLQHATGLRTSLTRAVANLSAKRESR